MDKRRRRRVLLLAATLLLAWTAVALHRLGRRADLVRTLPALTLFSDASQRRIEWLRSQRWIPARAAEWFAVAQPRALLWSKSTPATALAFVAEPRPELATLEFQALGGDEPAPLPRRAPALSKLVFTNGLGDRAALRAAPPLPSVESLSIARAEGLADLLGPPTRFPNLRRLELYDVAGIDEALPALAALPELAEFTLHASAPVALGGLSGLTSLRALDLAVPALDAEAMSAIARLENLRELAVDPGTIDRAALHRHGFPRGLESLRLTSFAPFAPGTGGGLADVLTVLSRSPSLRELAVDLTGDAAEYDALVELPALETLRLNAARRTPFGDAALARLAAAPRLRNLHVQCAFALTAGAAKALGRMPALETLAAEAGTCAPEFFAALAGHPGLRRLHLGEATLNPAVLATLESLPRLQEVYIRTADAAGVSLADLERIKELMAQRGGSFMLGRPTVHVGT